METLERILAVHPFFEGLDAHHGEDQTASDHGSLSRDSVIVNPPDCMSS